MFSKVQDSQLGYTVPRFFFPVYLLALSQQDISPHASLNTQLVLNVMCMQRTQHKLSTHKHTREFPCSEPVRRKDGKLPRSRHVLFIRWERREKKASQEMERDGTVEEGKF